MSDGEGNVDIGMADSNQRDDEVSRYILLVVLVMRLRRRSVRVVYVLLEKAKVPRITQGMGMLLHNGLL